MSKSDIKNINCDEVLKRVFDYIDENINEKSRLELEHHIEMCRHCFDRIEFEKMLKGRLRNLTSEELSDRLRKRVDHILTKF